MKKLILILVLFFTIKLVKAQPNLVPNPSFEDKFTCLNTTLLLEDYIYNWYGGRGYFNSCISFELGVPQNIFGHQYPHTGNAYSGIYTRGVSGQLRQNIQVKLLDTLQANNRYRVSFYVSLGDTLHANCNSIGAYFSTDSFFISYTSFLLEQMPQIQNSEENDLWSKTNWTLVCDTFIAAGNERYMTIGNFYNDSLSIFTPLDSVCSTPGSYGCAAYYYIDDVSVTLIDETGIEEQKQNSFSLFPNPNNGKFRLQFKSFIDKPMKLTITDLYGELIDEIIITNSLTNYENINLKNGIYFYTLRQGSEEIGNGKIMVMH